MDIVLQHLFGMEGLAGLVAAATEDGDELTTLVDPRIIHQGKWPLLFLLFGLLLAFIGVRINTRLIRKGVKWWPGNIEHGDLHIHHVVFGIAAMMIAGVVEFAVQPTGWAERIVALVFGGAMGVALDEFALILHLKDVYWQEEGRQSIDAVVIAVIVICMFLVGLAPLSIGDDTITTSRFTLTFYIAAQAVFVVITLLKGKLWSGIVGIFIPMFAWVGAVRLARPGSPWAHSHYLDKPRKMKRASVRTERINRAFGTMRRRLFDFIGGKPTAELEARNGNGAPRSGATTGSGADGGGLRSWDWRDYD